MFSQNFPTIYHVTFHLQSAKPTLYHKNLWSLLVPTKHVVLWNHQQVTIMVNCVPNLDHFQGPCYDISSPVRVFWRDCTLVLPRVGKIKVLMFYISLLTDACITGRDHGPGYLFQSISYHLHHWNHPQLAKRQQVDFPCGEHSSDTAQDGQIRPD